MAAPAMNLHYPGLRHPITERPAFIPSDTMLFGIVAEPQSDERRRRGVILLNTGADNHIGANRVHVSLGRRWARNGYVALRLDLGGLGDSATPDGCHNDTVFPETAVEEIRSAIEFMRARYGVQHLSVGGVCSGAYHALRAAAARIPINQIFMVNPQNYFWSKGIRIDELQLAEVVHTARSYVGQLFTSQAWNRLLRGEVSAARIAKICTGRLLLAAESTAREAARRLGIVLPNDLGADLRDISEHGVRMVFVFASDEPGLRLLKLQAGSVVKRLGDRCKIHIVQGADHIFSKHQYRAVLEDMLSNELFTCFQPRQFASLEPELAQSVIAQEN
jgi:alpha/beta superfamily hydrolase